VYRPDSNVSRLARGEVTLGDCAPEVGEILALCERLTEEAGGCFSAHPGGALDPRTGRPARSARSSAASGGSARRLAGSGEPAQPSARSGRSTMSTSSAMEAATRWGRNG
jgi:thiamine biosynthesis lipoprotein